jgi:hypothetical protein
MTTMPGEFCPHQTTLRPGPAPKPTSTFPSWLAFASSSANVHLRIVPSGRSSTTASLSGVACA